MLRSLLWLMAGLLVLVGLVLVSAPELVLADPAATSQLLLLAAVAGVPGLLVLVTIAARRRLRNDPGPDPDGGDHDPAARHDHRTGDIDQEH